MTIAFRTIHLSKRFPLAISRGVHHGSDNLFVGVTRNGVSGWGEMSPGVSEGAATADEGRAALERFFTTEMAQNAIHDIHQQAREAQVPPCALAALDIALWDALGKSAGLPLYRLLGLGLPTTPTSVTLGINPPEVVRERIPLLLDKTGIRSLKVKLGSPQGIEADRAMFAAVVDATRGRDLPLRVDANGGWSLDQAKEMMRWLASRGVEYIEQPLEEGQEHLLPELFRGRQLPIYLDESCRFAEDIPKWAGSVDGVNLKLMKCGGITEAVRIVAVARAFGLKTMIGCMGESSLSISAGAAIGALFDHIDLDSHLNLSPDPAVGVSLSGGIITPNDLPGHGAKLIDAQ